MDGGNKPSLDIFRKTYAAIEESLGWLVQEITTKPKTSIPLLTATILILFGSGYVFETFNFSRLFWDKKDVPWWYLISLGGLILVLLTIAGVNIYRRLKDVKKEVTEIKRRNSRAIKGLLSFNERDAEIFDKLERGTIAARFAQKIASDGFRFGILTGKSGCGKTSLLRAGVCPKLKEKEGCDVIYVKFTNEPPLKTIRESIAAVRGLNGNVENADLPQLLANAVKDNKQAVLIFDQFEQFFVHQRTPEERQEFALQMRNWFLEYGSLPAKILLGVRNDFRFEVDAEFQDKMQYQLSLDQNFILSKFTPEQAAKVFKALADDAGIECDEEDMKKISRTELANHEDGLISPVDVQILAEMMDKAQNYEQTTFDEKAFLQVGGVEGLMEQFLISNLDLISFDKNNLRRQTAVKVLLALTDLQQNTRRGILTVGQIQDGLGAAVSAEEITRAINFLELARLVTPNEKDEKKGYELSHERLIPALRRLANDELTEVARINHLLERRTREWIGNNQQGSRYLLDWSELRRIKKQIPFIDWGNNKDQKCELIKVSRQRVKFFAALTAAFALLLIGSVPLALYLWRTSDTVRYYRLSNDLNNMLKATNDGTALAEVAVSDIWMNKNAQATEALERIQNPGSRFQGYIRASYLLAQIGQAEEAAKFLLEAENIAKTGKIEPNVKLDMLNRLAGEWAKNGNQEKAASLFREALNHAQSFKYDNISAEGSKVYSAVKTAAVMGECGLKKLAFETFSQAMEKMRSLNESEKKQVKLNSLISNVIPETFAKAFSNNDIRAMNNLIIDHQLKADFLSAALDAKIKSNKTSDNIGELADDLISELNSINKTVPSRYYLTNIAKAYGISGRADAAENYLQKVLLEDDKVIAQYDEAERQSEQAGKRNDLDMVFTYRDRIAPVYFQIAKARNQPSMIDSALAVINSLPEDYKHLNGDKSQILFGLGVQMVRLALDQNQKFAGESEMLNHELFKRGYEMVIQYGFKQPSMDVIPDLAELLLKNNKRNEAEELIRKATAAPVGDCYGYAQMFEADTRQTKDDSLLNEAKAALNIESSMRNDLLYGTALAYARLERFREAEEIIALINNGNIKIQVNANVLKILHLSGKSQLAQQEQQIDGEVRNYIKTRYVIVNQSTFSIK